MYFFLDFICLFIIHISGYSITTWTKYYQILTTDLPQVDNCEHFTYYLIVPTYYLPFVQVTKHVLSTDHLTISSCPRNY